MAKETKNKWNRKWNRILPFLKKYWFYFLAAAAILLAAAVLAVSLWVKNLPSKEKADLKDYFGLADGVAYGLVIDREIVNDFPRKRAGYWYVSYETAHKMISDKIYFDGSSLLYTGPLETYTALPQEYAYTSDADETVETVYQPCYLEKGVLYVALEYIQLMDHSCYKIDSEQLYGYIRTDWTSDEKAAVKKDTELRTEADKKSPILFEAQKGDQVILLEEGSSWNRVQLENGLIGYMKKSALGDPVLTEEKPWDGRALPKYTTNLLDETVCMAWHQVFTVSGIEQLTEYLTTAEPVNVIVPTWFTISDNLGNIQNLGEKSYVQKAHRMGVDVWVMLDNINIPVDEAQIFGITENRRNLVNTVVSAALELGADGINLDMEDVGSANGDGMRQFFREMSAACRREGLVLSICNYSPMPHTAYYDRTQQAEMVDYIVVMAYDEHYQNGETAGSTSSISWVKQSAERTLQEVPAEKLVIGLPLYTRLWKETPEEFAADGAKIVENDNSIYKRYNLTSEGISMKTCEAIVEERKLTKSWLEDIQQYYVEYQEDNSLYRLWIEDLTSMKAKLKAAFSYDPAGVAFFKIGLETDDIWESVRSYLK